MLGLLRGVPNIDQRWEDNPAHFWLVLIAGLLSTAVGFAVREASIRRRDARLFLISLAFVASAGFLALHALATPGVLVRGKTTGFVVATPVGLVVAGCFAALSAINFRPGTAMVILRYAALLTWALFALILLWAAVSLAQVPPLYSALTPEEARGPLVGLAGVGVLLYATAAGGYFRIYRRRHARLTFAVSFAFALLAEALIVVVVALPNSWRLSWWEWHVLMLLSFAFVAYSARQEWHEERWSALYLDETLAGVKEVSILFADLEGYTSYSEHLAAPAVSKMLNAYFGRLVPLVDKEFGGEVHQIIGDALMVVFNKEGDQPDHAVRACRAALALQRESARIAVDHPEWPRFRVGVNSGEVATGLVGGERGLRMHGVIGDTVNLAARLEGQAVAGGVVIGAGTYDQLPDGVEVERLPELHVKGKEAAVEAYTLRMIV